jgi:hypothetical protein
MGGLIEGPRVIKIRTCDLCNHFHDLRQVGVCHHQAVYRLGPDGKLPLSVLSACCIYGRPPRTPHWCPVPTQEARP